MMKLHVQLLVGVGIVIGFMSGCRTVAPSVDEKGDSFLTNQVDRVMAWLKTRDARNVRRIDVPEVPGVRLAFLDRTTNGAFGVTLCFETNRLNVIVSDGLKAGKKAEEFDLYCTLANQGRMFWHWLHDKESDVLVIQGTLCDYRAIGAAITNVVPLLTEIGEGEFRACGTAMRKLKKGELTPDAAWRAGPGSESCLLLSTTDPNENLAEVYQQLWDALRDKVPVKWDGKARYPISFDLGINAVSTKSTVSTNQTCWIRADRHYVESFIFRKWGKGNKLKEFAPLVVKCNQDRGDGRWACVEGGEFCIRGTYPLPYVLDDPRRFVTEFVMRSAGEILANEEDMRRLVPEGNDSP